MPTIRELRLERDMSQAALAARSGLSIPVISRMENGHAVQPYAFKLVCQALEVSPSTITGVNVSSAVQAAAKRKKRP